MKMLGRLFRDRRRPIWSLPIFALLGLLLLSLLAAGAVEKLHARDERLAQAEMNATALGLLVDQHASRVFEEVGDALGRLADRVGDHSWGNAERSRALWQFAVRLTSESPLLHSLEIYDQDGRLRLSSSHYPTPRHGMIPFDPARLRERLAAAAGPLEVGGPVRSQEDGRWLVSVAAAITDERGAFRGFVVGTIEPRTIGDFIRWAPIDRHGAIELLNDDGAILAGTEPDERLIGERSAGAGLLGQLRPGAGGIVLRGDLLGDGVKRIVAVRHMERLPVAVLVELTQADVLQDWLRRFVLEFMIAVAVMVGFGMLLMLLYRRIEGEQRATVAARLAEQRLNDAIESTAEAFALWDARDRLVVCNSRYRELHAKVGLPIEPGLSFAELVEASVAFGLYILDRTPEEWIRQRMERHGRPAGTFEQQHADGRWMLVSERRTSEGGVVGIRTDITALKQKESELESLVRKLDAARARTEAQAAELARLAEGYAEAHRRAAQANAGKTMFLASMSHELRTPLNAIIGFSELMMRETFGPLGNRRYAEYVADVHRSGQHLLELINDVLDLSKIEAGKLNVRLGRQNLAELVEESVRLVSDRARGKGISLSVELPRDLPSARADRRATKQILLNLLSNAVKFTGKGGSITVTGAARNGTVTIAVRDTGIGIAPRDLDRLFKPFERARNAESLEGSGLGLAIARGLAEGIGGALRLESKVGEGTVVWLDLPVAGEGASAANAA